jgi:hypothetical protein
MRSHNPQRSEDGFGWIHPRASDYANELIAEFAQAG